MLNPIKMNEPHKQHATPDAKHKKPKENSNFLSIFPTFDSDTKFLLKSCLLSKLFMLFVCFWLNNPVADKNEDRWHFQANYNRGKYGFADGVSFMLNWDGHYFFNTILRGYDNIKQYAFYPGFPMFVRYLNLIVTTVIPGLSSYLEKEQLQYVFIIIIGFAMNMCLHVMNTLMFAKLASLKGLPKYQCTRIALFFTLSGPTLFHMTLYSESLYLFLTLFGLIALETYVYRPESRPVDEIRFSEFLTIILPLAASAFVRSVGTLSFAYIGYPLLIEVIQKYLKTKKISAAAPSVLRILVALLLFITPTIFLFLRTRYLYCNPAAEHVFDQANFTPPTFCNSKLGFFYGYVQENFWGVRFLGQLRHGNVEVYLLSLNSLVVILTYFRRVFGSYAVKDIVTANLGRVVQGESYKSKDISYFPDLCIMLIFFRTFYFYAHQNSIERFLCAHPFYFFILNDFQQESTIRCAQNTKNLKKSQLKHFFDLILKYLPIGNIAVRMILTPFLFATNIHPI